MVQLHFLQRQMINNVQTGLETNVINKSGSTLPTTGGMGTTILLRCWSTLSWRSYPFDHQEAHERTLIVLSARLIP